MRAIKKEIFLEISKNAWKLKFVKIMKIVDKLYYIRV